MSAMESYIFQNQSFLTLNFLLNAKKQKKIITSPYDDVSEVIKNNQIFIKSSKYEWEIQNGIGSMAFRTLWSIFKEYQKEEKLPEQWSSLS